MEALQTDCQSLEEAGMASSPAGDPGTQKVKGLGQGLLKLSALQDLGVLCCNPHIPAATDTAPSIWLGPL